MNLMEMVLNSNGGGVIKELSKNFGLGESDTQGVVKSLMPSIARGIKNNASSDGGLESLLGALSKGNHQQFLDNPSSLGKSETTQEGNSILGHILGSKDVSRNVASRAAQETGQDSGMVKKMLPMIAAAAMGALSKQNPGSGSGGGAMGMLGSLMGGGQKSSGSSLGALGSFLDADGDGDVLDDVLKLGKKFF
ncbi:MAG: DUF937 domain-containing protein [Nitrospinales bacterium]